MPASSPQTKKRRRSLPGGKYKVRWLKKALENIEAEAEYVAQESPAAAAAVVATIREAVSTLERYPCFGRAACIPERRERVIPDTPYNVPYGVKGKTVEVPRVFHASRRWPGSF